MKTEFLLLARFENPTVFLEDICREFFDLSKHTAGNRAKAQSLPIPAFRLGSQKSPWMVHIKDLADYIDKCREEAREDWEKAS